jgi:nucleotide-binding universal stress UspA family protein
MHNAILVPLDGTSFAEAALPVAMSLARRDHLPLRLVTVWEPYLGLYDVSGGLALVEREEHRQRHRYMAETARRVQEASGRPVSVEYHKGRAGEILPALPESGEVDLVVMSTHARGALASATLGSVADQMVRRCSVPVLLVRPDSKRSVQLEPAGPIRRILVPLDGSELAERALQESVLTSPGEPVEITLLRLLAFPLTPAERAVKAVDGRIVRAERVRAEAYLESVARWLEPWNCRVTIRASEEASPWTGIADFAAANKFDLIAMTTHGRGGAARLLLGSIANRVVRSSTVPVLLFHPERAASPWRDVEQLAGQVVGMP